jgi:RNA polymerase sigma factor (sigma-70 family)
LDSENPTQKIEPASGVFATTRWTVVLAAGDPDAPQATVALEELCRTYWYPLYAYIRRRGHSREDAEDLTQAFFARLLEKNFLEGITSDKGKFRAFLLTAVKRFMANEWDRAHAEKRGGAAPTLSLDWQWQDADERYKIDPADNLSPDKLYDRAWAVTMLERVITRLRDESLAEGKSSQYEQLRPFLMVGKADIPFAQAAAALNMTEGAVRVAVHRLRRRYREVLRDEIAQTLSDPAQADEELQALFTALSAAE